MTEPASTATAAPTLTFALDRVPTPEGGIPIGRSEKVTLEISPTDAITPEQMEAVQRHGEFMAALFRDKPDEVRSLVNHLVAGRTDAARETARRIGFREAEADFKEEPDSMWPWIAVVGIVIIGCAAFGCPTDGPG